MGLDVISYQTAQLTEDHPRRKGCYDLDHLYHDESPEFPLSSLGLEPGRCYVCSGATVEFRAGSYSGYSRWRSLLCELALEISPHVIWESPEAWKESPFFELINFTDCDGKIGPLAAASLYDDFSRNRGNIPVHDPRLDWFVSLYDTWTKAFATAANDGLVLFC